MTHSKEFAFRVRSRRKELGYTQEGLAKMLGMTKGGVSHWEVKGHIPPGERLLELADRLHCSVEWLRFGTGEGGDRSAAIAGVVSDGGIVRMKRDEKKEIVPLPSLLAGRNVRAWRVQTASLAPRVSTGDIIYTAPSSSDLDPENLIGSLAIVHLADGRTMLRVIEPSAEVDRFALTAPNFSPIEVNLDSLEPVVLSMPSVGRSILFGADPE
ncbi:MAG: helix-turn-helix domain-containing protein [Geminicoccaceae bacterium]